MSVLPANTKIVIGQKGVAARATPSGCSHTSGSTAAALLPLADGQSKKFIVTLKPVSKLQASNSENSLHEHQERKHIMKHSIRIKADDALKGKTLLSEFFKLFKTEFYSLARG